MSQEWTRPEVGLAEEHGWCRQRMGWYYIGVRGAHRDQPYKRPCGIQIGAMGRTVPRAGGERDRPGLPAYNAKFPVLREGVCRETRGGDTPPAPHSRDEVVGTPLH